MRIKTRVRLSAAFAVVIALTVGVVLAVGLRTVEAAIEHGFSSTESLNELFELSMLTTDYLINYEPRAERQWEDKYADLAGSLDALETPASRDGIVHARVRTNLDEAHATFRAITSAHQQGLSGEVALEVSLEYQSRLTARLLVLMQSMVSDMTLLGQHASEDATAAQQMTNLLVLAISVIGVFAMIIIGLMADRTITVPLDNLRHAAARVGRGNLEVRSGIATDDEVGEFAQAFDGMIVDLQGSYTMLEREIAERRRAEDALSEYRDHLEQLVEDRTTELVAVNEDLTAATRAKDDFLAAMSHELRTPLNSIIGFTDLMLKGLTGEINAEQRRQLGMVHSSGRQLLTLVNEILELSRINAGQVSVTPAPFSPAASVGRLIEMMMPLAHGKGLALTWHANPDVPDEIISDGGRVDQILLNLLSNAVKFTDAGEIEVVIRSHGPGAVAFDVRDTGAGIPPEKYEEIFEHFRQLNTQRPIGEPGTGLGLAISRRLAEALGGSLTVSSEVGVGSTFTLTLEDVVTAA